MELDSSELASSQAHQSDGENRRAFIEAAFDAAENESSETKVATYERSPHVSEKVVNERSETRRSAIEAAFDAPEKGRARDEKGKFLPKDTGTPAVTSQNELQEVNDAYVDVAPVAPAEEKKLSAPTHWKREYRPLWDKLNAGDSLTPEEARQLANYSIQRESEFASGVSSYKTKAQEAEHLQQAIAPYASEFQKYNISPAEGIKKLCAAHKGLSEGTPEQKLQMLAQLAVDYAIPLGALTGNQNPAEVQLMQEVQALSNWKRQEEARKAQEEERQVYQVLAQFEDTDKYPYFQVVRNPMSQLLDEGFTTDPDVAYEEAVRRIEDIWTAEQERQAQSRAKQDASLKAAALAKAKSNAISVKSVTPSGIPKTSYATDRRSLIAEQFAARGM